MARFLTSQDAVTRLRHSFLLFDKDRLCFVHEINSKKEGIFAHCSILLEPKICEDSHLKTRFDIQPVTSIVESVDVNDESLISMETFPDRTGFAWFGGSTAFLERRGTRQYKQGYNNQNTRIIFVNATRRYNWSINGTDSFPGLSQMFYNVYPDISCVLRNLHNKYWHDAPLSRDFALSCYGESSLAIWYQDSIIGWTDLSLKKLNVLRRNDAVWDQYKTIINKD